MRKLLSSINTVIEREILLNLIKNTMQHKRPAQPMPERSIHAKQQLEK